MAQRNPTFVQRVVLLIAAFLTLVAVPSLALPAPADAQSGLVVQPQGHAYSDASEAWWQWAHSLPAHKHPLLDQGRVDCGQGQHGDLWFIGGTIAPGFVGPSGPIDRTCTIPSGTRLFFPVFNAWSDNVLVSPQCTELGLRDIIKPWVDGATGLVASVDGQAIPGVAANGLYRTRSGSFSYQYPGGSLLCALGGCDANNQGACPTQTARDSAPLVVGSSRGGVVGPAPAQGGPVVADGVYVMLNPLGPGAHTIHFEAPTGGLNVTYHITVR